MDADASSPDALVERARAVREHAHAPYTGYAVGAAVETTDGTVHAGCNVEVVTLSETLHAEAVAVGRAIAAGADGLSQVAVSGPDRDGLTPCGACRQTLREFAPDSMPIHCDAGDRVETRRLGDLLPHAMEPETLR